MAAMAPNCAKTARTARPCDKDFCPRLDFRKNACHNERDKAAQPQPHSEEQPPCRRARSAGAGSKQRRPMRKSIEAAVFLGMFFAFALAANAQIPRVQLVWNPDHTVWPPVLQTSGGGVLGGDWHYTITFPTTPNVGYNVTNIVLTSATNGLTNPVYQPNGDYTLTVSSTQTFYSNGAYVTTPLPDQTIHFTLANPFVSATLPADADPILWPPAPFSPGSVTSGQNSAGQTVFSISGQNLFSGGPYSGPSSGKSSGKQSGLSAVSSALVPISITVDGCYPCEATVVVRIHDPRGYGIPAGAATTLEQNVTLKPGKNVVTFYWDGNGGAAQPGAYAFDATVYYCYGYSQAHTAPFDVSNGGFAAPNEFAYAYSRSEYNDVFTPGWRQSHNGPAWGMQVTKVFDNGINATFALQYAIAGRSEPPFGSNSAYDSVYDCSGGQIDVYNGAMKILTQTLQPSDVTDIYNDVTYRGASWDTVHTVNVTVPSNLGDNSTFILSPRDSFGLFNDSHQSRYLTQAAYRTPAKSGDATVYFDRSIIKVGHGPVSGLQTVNAYVTPYSAAAGLSFGTSASYEAIVVGDVFPPAHSGNAAVVKLTIVGQATGTPVNPQNPSASTPDCQITVNGVVPSQSPSILVLIPTRLSKTHPQIPLQHVDGLRFAVNNTTSPGDPVTIAPDFLLTTGYTLHDKNTGILNKMAIQVWDQFGLNLDDTYTGASVEELFNNMGSWKNINSPMLSNGTYLDPIVFASKGVSRGPTHDAKLINGWLSLPIGTFGADDYLDTVTDYNVPDLGIRIDGVNTLTSKVAGRETFGVVGRVLSSVAPDQIQVVWPDTP